MHGNTRKDESQRHLQIELLLVVLMGDLDGTCGFDALPRARNVEIAPVYQALWQLPPVYKFNIVNDTRVPWV